MAGKLKNRNTNMQETIGEPADRKTVHVTIRGVIKRVSAINLCFLSKKVFIAYEPPPYFPHLRPEDGSLISFDVIKGTPESADIEEWLEKMEFIKDDLQWLLRLPHPKFWSQVIYDENLQGCLDSYLTHCPRYYDFKDPILTEEMQEISRKIHRLIFMVFLRMATHKESQHAHLTPLAHGEYIYNNYLFDIPKMMDICVLYGRENKQLLSRAIQNIFTTQPLYSRDLEAAVKFVHQTLKMIRQKLGILSGNLDSSIPIKLDDKLPKSEIQNMSWEDLDDVVSYIVDTGGTLGAFQEIYPAVCHMFNRESLETSFVDFYEDIFPLLVEELSRRRDNIKCNISELEKKISFAKSSFLKMFRANIVECFIRPMLETSSNGNDEATMHYIDKFLEVMIHIVSEKRPNFMCDYQLRFPFEEDAELMMQLPGAPDSERVDYIINSIASSFELLEKPCPERLWASSKHLYNIESVAVSTNVSPSAETHQQDMENGDVPWNLNQSSENSIDYMSMQGACASPLLSDDAIELLACNVLDLFPELGYGFVEACLEFYNFDSERVINSILEDSLPSPLATLDRNMPKREKVTEKSLVSQRRCVYDNDEFDVFSRDSIDANRVHKGKRDDTPQTMTSLSNDKSALEITREICQRLAIVEATGYEKDLLYEDEYDDTYDSNMIGPSDDTLDNELLSRRPFQKPRVFETPADNEVDDELEDESEDEEQNQKPRDEFVADPAVQREIAERRRQEQNHRGQRRDVRGQPKGRGQDPNTLRNRSRKEQHKARIANHNRRAGSEWKRRQGMFPA